MEFLKNHYEKIVLSLVLIGLAGVAGWLALQSMGFRSTIKAVNELKPKPGPVDTSDKTNEFFVALTNATAPQEVDFDGEHKIFNPEKILRQVGTIGLIPQNKIGPKNLQIQQIRPLRLRLRAESKLVIGKPRLYIHYLPEFELGNYAKRWGKSSATEGRTIRLTGPVSRSRRVVLIVNRIAGDLTNSASLEIDLDLVVGAGLPEPLTLIGTNIWEKEFEFEVNLFHSRLKQNYSAIRLNTPLVFGGDTNTVIQITEDEVTLRARSNDKRTTLSLTKQRAAAAAAVDAAAAKAAVDATAEGGAVMQDGQMPSNGTAPDGQGSPGGAEAGNPNAAADSAPVAKKAAGAP